MMNQGNFFSYPLRKTVLTFLILLPLSYAAVGQASQRFYYNKNWELARKDSAVYHRTAGFYGHRLKFNGFVADSTLTGKRVMTGWYVNELKNGKFTYYDNNGLLEAEGEFKDDVRIGTWRYFYPNGTVMQEADFTATGFVVRYFNDSAGARRIENGTGHWVYAYEEYQAPVKIVVEGDFVKGKKNGNWVCRLATGDTIYTEVFKDGKFRSGKMYEAGRSPRSYNDKEIDNKLLPHFKHGITEAMLYEKGVTQDDYLFIRSLPAPPPSADHDTTRIFISVETPPRPKDGLHALYTFIARNITYPADARRSKIEGRVVVTLVVEKDGSLSNVKSLAGIGYGCDEEAVRVVKLSSPWDAGVHNDDPVRVRMQIPVTFKLETVKVVNEKSRK